MYQILFHILLYDIWYYMLHVFLHKNIYFVHKCHHLKSYNKLTFLDTYEGDIIEKPIQLISIIIPYYLPNSNLYTFMYFCIIIIMRDLLKHDHRCVWLTGNHHILHHKHPKYNFGEYWIDTLCGTKYPNQDAYIYGLIYV